MNNYFKKHKKACLLTLLAIICISSILPAMAFSKNKYKVVFFYANWNSDSRQAKQDLSDLTNKNPHIALINLNIDQNATLDKARKLGLRVPNKIPYIIIMNNNDKILYKKKYSEAAYKKINNIVSK